MVERQQADIIRLVVVEMLIQHDIATYLLHTLLTGRDHHRGNAKARDRLITRNDTIVHIRNGQISIGTTRTALREERIGKRHEEAVASMESRIALHTELQIVIRTEGNKHPSPATLPDVGRIATCRLRHIALYLAH